MLEALIVTGCCLGIPVALGLLATLRKGKIGNKDAAKPGKAEARRRE